MPPQVTVKPLSAVLLDLPNTIRDPEFKKTTGTQWFLKHVSEVLSKNWEDPSVIDVVRNVRNESAVLQKDAKYKDIPQVAAADRSKSSIISSIEEYSRYLCNKNAIPEPRGFERLKSIVWREGFKNKTLTVPLYPDFITAAANWKRSKILVFGTTDSTANEQKVYLGNTDAGKITKVFDFITGGDGQNPVMFDKEWYDKQVMFMRGKPAKEMVFITDNDQKASIALQAGITVAIIHRTGAAKNRMQGIFYITQLTDICY